MTFQEVTLEVVVENAAALSDKQKTDPAEFALIRRNGFGASDAATLLGVSPWKGIDELIKEKASTEITKEELAIGEKPNVRKGAELEPLILQKFEDWANKTADIRVAKPAPMYKIVEFPQLTVNFDGIINDAREMQLSKHGVPVEAKMVSMFAEKYWDHSKALVDLDHVPGPVTFPTDRLTPDTIKALSTACGIPVYYYTQCQQQMLAKNADMCFLAALHDKDWTLRVYYVPRNELVINKLKEAAYVYWKQVETKKILQNRR